jgi:hypothetical protein
MCPKIYNGYCHIFYVLDKDAGCVVQSEGIWTLNDIKYQRVPITAIPATPVLGVYPMHCDSTGMPGTAPPPILPIDVTLTPTNPPIVIPSFGGVFQYTVVIHSNDSIPRTIDANIHAILPNGNSFTVLTRPNMTMAPGSTITRVMTQMVPGTAPAGNYLYVAEARDHTTQAVLDSAYFNFTKTGADNAGKSQSEWTLNGWEENLSEAPFNIHHSSFIISASPNPFNSSTVISFDLANASLVDLRIYNINGQEVWRLETQGRRLETNKVVWDAEGLPSGIYFVKLSAANRQSSVQKLLLLK